MKLSEIKKLNRVEFAKRYPFVQTRYWDSDKLEYYLATYEENDYCVQKGIAKVGEPVLQFFTDASDLLLCWAEKVKTVFDKMPKEAQDALYIMEFKEKYGYLRMYLTGLLEEPYSKINDYTTMLEQSSIYTCSRCNKISKEKKPVTYRSNDYWIEYCCRDCAKLITYNDIKEYKIDKRFELKCKLNGKNPLKEIFKQQWIRKSGSWYSTIISNNKTTRLDCRELFEDMF